MREAAQPIYASVDSAPSHLSDTPHPLTVAMMLCLFAGISALMLAAFDFAHNRLGLTYHPDFVFYRYEGNNPIPLRCFLVCFTLAGAPFFNGDAAAKAAFALRTIVFFLMFAALFDATDALCDRMFGVALDVYTAEMLSGLFGLLMFGLSVLSSGNMPARADVPVLSRRFLARSWFVLILVLSAAGAITLWCSGLDLSLVAWMRSTALLGGLGPGIFLFLPLCAILFYALGRIGLRRRRRAAFTPPVTVVAAAHNESHIIPAMIEAVDAAAAQYGGSVKLIVVDNASTDDTAALAEAGIDRLRFCNGTVLSEKRLGKARALNTGLAAVQKDFVLRIDADTLVGPSNIARAMTYFVEDRVGIVGGLSMPPGDGPFDRARAIEVLMRSGVHQVGFNSFEAIVGIPGMFALYRTEALRRQGGFATGINGEDTDASLRIGELGYRIIEDPAIVYVSEVPANLANLREQRLRWFRSIYHVAARNRTCMDDSSWSVRGKCVLPFMLMNSGRRAVTIPLLIFGLLCDATEINPLSPVATPAIFATVLGAPVVMAFLSTFLARHPKAASGMGDYFVFRILRAYFTLEAILSIRLASAAPPGRRDVGMESATQAGLR
ncbi:glycosyltransferase [Antarcticirhabdus aurantiaca]|uniref:Glycosyltransferase family 2 protein n=1 Tax=Antarcticirhabdus aurantiaca TaxID=2606717 RepID=A0ACD4NMT5_9HYPH|nr:glycosyltransferase family 2 protein [Antarcticirhabdus aurantiaca]WAJ28167.1 glycosyltransferase family 2 protein [Jeongeuplla avenae]